MNTAHAQTYIIYENLCHDGIACGANNIYICGYYHAGSPFIISSMRHKDVCCKPGEEVKFTVSTPPSATTCVYQWYFENQAITVQNPDYKGQTSKCLLVLKCLPKHKGVYWCISEDESGTQITSRHEKLTAGIYTCLLKVYIYIRQMTVCM